MEARGEERSGEEGHDLASREERPCWAGAAGGGGLEEEATNYLVDSVNWSHSGGANLGPTILFVSETYCV